MSTSELVPLYIAMVKPGLHERAQGITHKPIYRISWPKRTIRLFGKWRMPNTKKGSANYIRVSEQRIKLPPDAEKQWRLAKRDTEVQEVAIFIDTHLTDARACLILAAQVSNDWFEFYRGCSSWRKLGLCKAIVHDQ